MSVLPISLQQLNPVKQTDYRVKEQPVALIPASGIQTSVALLSLQAAGAVQLKQTFPDRVIYTLSVPQATSEDSGTYECSVTDVFSGEVRVSSVAVAVFGESFSTSPARCHI